MSKQEKLFSFPLRLPQELDRLFDEIIHRPWGFAGELQEWNPSIDLYETSEAFILEADLPGVKGDEVKVEVVDSKLILRGRRSFERTRSDGRFHYQERCCGEFLRQITLPGFVDKDKISANFSDGVLRVVLPKLKGERGRNRS